jgi:23S rRNA (cytidine1920-2'-O)/16S rRNA (cytidine1409-2'-O)-methyltransferase
MKERIDIFLVERRLVESRTKAQWLIKNGYVVVDGNIITKPGKRIDISHDIQLKKKFPYVSRGGLKLEVALDEFSIRVENRVCVDIGSSTGGFTDCLLQHGAKKVYSIDIALDRLHPSLRCEKMKGRVVPLLGVDARQTIDIDENIDICAIDVTFTSLKSILPNVKQLLSIDGDILALVKPLFESQFRRKQRVKNIEESSFLYKILVDLIEWIINNHFNLYGIIKSPQSGIEHSVEFLMHLRVDKYNKTYNFKENILKLLNISPK